MLQNSFSVSGTIFMFFIMLTRYLVEDSSSKTYDFSPISQRMRLFCRLQRVFRNSWGEKCIGRNVAEIKFSHFCPFSIGTIIPKMHHLTLKGRKKIRVTDILHKGRSIEIYNKQCLVLLICKNSEFLGIHFQIVRFPDLHLGSL